MGKGIYIFYVVVIGHNGKIVIIILMTVNSYIKDWDGL